MSRNLSAPLNYTPTGAQAEAARKAPLQNKIMLAVRAPPPSSSHTQPQLSTAHLLPCRIHHDGPVRTSRRYWDPKPGHGPPSILTLPKKKDERAVANEENNVADGKPEAYFRGRRLNGRPVRVPEGYRGVVVREGEEEADKVGKGGAIEEEMEEGDEEEQVEVKTLDEVARFEELVVWGHETVPEDDDVFVKGVEEWIRFAEAVSLSFPFCFVIWRGRIALHVEAVQLADFFYSLLVDSCQ